MTGCLHASVLRSQVCAGQCHCAQSHTAHATNRSLVSSDQRATCRTLPELFLRHCRAARNTLSRAVADGASTADAVPDAAPDAAPSFTLVFQESDGNERTLEGVESGDILRDVMLVADPAVDLYTTWGKVVSCGGGGQCGTCVVEVLEGGEHLEERNDTEQKKLKKKPSSYRLACQLNVGDGTDSGTIRFKTKPK